MEADLGSILFPALERAQDERRVVLDKDYEIMIRRAEDHPGTRWLIMRRFKVYLQELAAQPNGASLPSWLSA